MFKVFFFIAPLIFPLLTVAQDLKFELLTKWESLTPEFPIGFGNNSAGIDIFNIGDVNNDGTPDVGFRTSDDHNIDNSKDYDSLYVITLNKNGSIKNS